MTDQTKDRVAIFDTTLRDGEQSPGATMTHDEKLEIAGLLDEMGVDIIEAGFPIASEGDFRAVKEIAERSRQAVICGLARANPKDIDRCWDAVKHSERPRIHTFIGTSPLHRTIPNLTQDEMAERIHETVTHARNLCDNVQWSPMDATRTEWDYLKRVVEIAIKAGATTINIPDTVGYTAPVESADLIRRLIAEVDGRRGDRLRHPLPQRPWHGHGQRPGGRRGRRAADRMHDQRARGTRRQHRAGRGGDGAQGARRHHALHHHVDTTKIMNISRRVATVSGFPVQFNKAIVGKNAFAHESGIHQDGMLKNAETFEIMRPEDVGLTETNIVMGKHSGRAALRSKLKELGYELSENQLGDVFYRFKELADRKKEVYDEDLIALVHAGTDDENDRLQITSLEVVCGTSAPQTARLTMEIDGAEKSTEATGDGPVDATFNAVKALFPHEARLQLYQVHAVTEGTDAQATVSVRMEEEGRIVTGQSADTDTVVASARAYVHALNRLLVRREQGGGEFPRVSYKDVS